MIRVTAALGAVLTVFGIEIDPLKHHVTPLAATKFDSVINKHRSWQTAAVFFHRGTVSDKTTKSTFAVFDETAKQLKGMFRFAAIDCDKDAKFCQENNVQTTPAVLVYPRNPMPAFAVKNLDKAESLVKTLNKQLPTEHIKTLDASNIDAFLSTDNNSFVPRVLFFSDKKKAPALFKALSNEFRNEMQFGLVVMEQSPEIAARFKVTKANTLIMQESRQGKPVATAFKGDLNFSDVHTWTNLRRETFVKGGGFSDATGAGSAGEEAPKKPWRNEDVPELTKESANEVCFKQESLCLIYLRAGKIEQSEIDTLMAIKSKFSNELASLKLGYIDLIQEPAYQTLFLATSLPSAVLFNPHKRLRFSALTEGVLADHAGLTNLLERALSGDARYKPVKELPIFSKRPQAAKPNDEL